MAEITISIPDAMNAYVADRVDSDQYGDAGESFRDLVRREQERREAEAKLRKMLDRAEDSGVSTRQIPEIVAAAEARLRADGKI